KAVVHRAEGRPDAPSKVEVAEPVANALGTAERDHRHTGGRSEEALGVADVENLAGVKAPAVERDALDRLSVLVGKLAGKRQQERPLPSECICSQQVGVQLHGKVSQHLEAGNKPSIALLGRAGRACQGSAEPMCL